MRLALYQVDAFTSRQFGGNPAAVCPLEEWLPDSLMQAIAAENNLSETAFFAGGGGSFQLRWFTPETEVDLCGHATLASAWVIFQHLCPELREVKFQTRSGELVVSRHAGELLAMDFPSRPPVPIATPPHLAEALGVEPTECLASRDLLAVLRSEEEVRNLRPNLTALSEMNWFAVTVTAPGTDCDFVSRFFAPKVGVPEDPVTGSAHCTLAPYWRRRLGKSSFFARQLSRRGGELWLEDRGDRVLICGQAVLYLRGTIEI